MSNIVQFPMVATKGESAETYKYSQLVFLPDEFYSEISLIQAVNGDQYTFGTLLFIENTPAKSYSYYLYDTESELFRVAFRFHITSDDDVSLEEFTENNFIALAYIESQFGEYGDVAITPQFETSECPFVPPSLNEIGQIRTVIIPWSGDDTKH